MPISFNKSVSGLFMRVLMGGQHHVGALGEEQVEPGSAVLA